MTIQQHIAAEMERADTGTYKGYAVAELRRVLHLITDPDNWKNPIRASIDVADLGAAINAAEFFCGSALYAPHPVTAEQKILIVGPGYYASVGA